MRVCSGQTTEDHSLNIQILVSSLIWELTGIVNHYIRAWVWVREKLSTYDVSLYLCVSGWDKHKCRLPRKQHLPQLLLRITHFPSMQSSSSRLLACHTRHSSTPYRSSMKCKITLKVLVVTIDAQWEGMGDVGSKRYEPALLPPCPIIRVLSYSNNWRTWSSQSKMYLCSCTNIAANGSLWTLGV